MRKQAHAGGCLEVIRKVGWQPKQKALVALVAACFAWPEVYANPVGPQVVNGQASVVANGTTLSITNTPGAVINWQGFSINANETTRFIQQSAASSVLNRVVTPDPSVILGALQSNGRVFLINPAGVLVGAGARIDVGGFVASTLNITNADFAAGKMNFQGQPGAGNVINKGNITTPVGGYVYLVGTNVTNEGVIQTPQGETILAAGNSVRLIARWTDIPQGHEIGVGGAGQPHQCGWGARRQDRGERAAG